jgi:hypothetical protein
MASEKPVRRTTGKRASARKAGDAPAPERTRQPEHERRYVDVDPWVMLLEQLMEVPEESAPIERERPKGK